MKFEVYESAVDIPQERWDALLVRNSITCSVAFWEMIERSALNDFVYRYALLFDDSGNPLALTTFYTVTNDLAIFAEGGFRRFLDAVRRRFPGFMKIRMLECGTPITVNPPCILAEGANADEVIPEIDRLLRAYAEREKAWLIVVRDFEAADKMLSGRFSRLGYRFVRSLPNTFLPIRWHSGSEYLAAMKSYYRSKLRRHLRKNEQQTITHEECESFADLAPTLCRQWLVVHNQADEYQREVLTPEFYRRFSETPSIDSRALLFYREGVLAGHALILRDGPVLRWLYFGRDRAANDSLYLYVAHAVVEAAIEMRVTGLEMGLTTYPVKRDLGAQMVENRIALSGRWLWMNPLIAFFYPYLNKVPPIDNKQVFKRDE